MPILPHSPVGVNHKTAPSATEHKDSDGAVFDGVAESVTALASIVPYPGAASTSPDAATGDAVAGGAAGGDEAAGAGQDAATAGDTATRSKLPKGLSPDVNVSATYHDLEAIREATTVEDVLAEAGLEIVDARRACPLCHSDNESCFKVFGETGWKCFRCGEHGDVFNLYQRLHRVGFVEAVAALARVAEIAPGSPPSPEAKRVRDEERAAKRAETARKEALKRSAGAKRASEVWYHRMNLRDSRLAEGRRYLKTRDIEVVAYIRRWQWILTFGPGGSPSVPIWSLETGNPSFFGREFILNVMSRRTDGGTPRQMSLTGSLTSGSFGLVSQLLFSFEVDGFVLCEGVIDYLTALVLFGNHYRPGEWTNVFGGRWGVIGAQCADRIPWLVEALATDRRLGAEFRKRPLLLVSHLDPPNRVTGKRAGEEAEKKVAALVKRYGIDACAFDYGGIGDDLNSWWTTGGRRFHVDVPTRPLIEDVPPDVDTDLGTVEHETIEDEDLGAIEGDLDGNDF